MVEKCGYDNGTQTALHYGDKIRSTSKIFSFIFKWNI